MKAISIFLTSLFLVVCWPASSQNLHRYFVKGKYAVVSEKIHEKGIIKIENPIELKDCATVSLWNEDYRLALEFYDKAFLGDKSIFEQDDCTNYLFCLLMLKENKRANEIANHIDESKKTEWFKYILSLLESRSNFESTTRIDVKNIVPIHLKDLLPQYGINCSSGKVYYSCPSIICRSDDDILFESRIINNRRKEFAGIMSFSFRGDGSFATPELEAKKVSKYLRIATMNKDLSGNNIFYTAVPLKGKPERIIVKGKLRSFPYNSNKYSHAMPFFEEENSRLYFCSDMPGGIGGWDIYYSDLKNGRWSYPINLGSKVNTPFDEIFPSITAKGLVFSSNAREGFGGFDNYIFNDRTQETSNLLAFNSSGNDFSLHFLDDKTLCAIGIRDSMVVYYSPSQESQPPLTNEVDQAGDQPDMPESATSQNTNENKSSVPLSSGLNVDEIYMKKNDSWEVNPSDTNMPSLCTINYDVDSFSVKQYDKAKLDSLVASRKQPSSSNVFIRGYTDETGNRLYNNYLSYKRVQAVSDYLKNSKAIPTERICLIVFGSNSSSGKNESGRKSDRKTELFFSDIPIPYPLLYQIKLMPSQSLNDVAQQYNNDLSLLTGINKIKDKESSELDAIFVGIQDFYQVKAGENLFRIALNHGCTYEKLQKINNKKNSTVLVGEILLIPFCR